MSSAGAKMRAAGQVLTYHNQALEFKKFGGKTWLRNLYDLTDPGDTFDSVRQSFAFIKRHLAENG